MNNERSNHLTNINIYPYACVFEGRRRILLWQAGNDAPDSFMLDVNDRLIFADTEEELRGLVSSSGLRVNWSGGAEVDLDRFWKTLRYLRIGRASSKKTCEILLNGWNFIEDLARTFQLTHDLERLQSPILNKVYKKLFSGNNLLSLTPEGKSYSPLWESEELTAMRQAFKDIKTMLNKRLCDIGGGPG